MSGGVISVDLLSNERKKALYVHENVLFRVFSDTFAGRFIKIYKPDHYLRIKKKKNCALRDKNQIFIRSLKRLEFDATKLSYELTPNIFQSNHICKALNEPCTICGIGMSEDEINKALSRFAKTVLIHTNNALDILALDQSVRQRIYALKWHSQRLLALQMYAAKSNPHVHKHMISQKHREFRERLLEAVEASVSLFLATLSIH